MENKEKKYTELFDVACPESDSAFMQKVMRSVHVRSQSRRGGAFRPLYALAAVILVIGVSTAVLALGNRGSDYTNPFDTYTENILPEIIDEPKIDDSEVLAPVSEAPRTITIASWYDYTAFPPMTNELLSEHTRAVEKKHNVTIEFVNLGWDGIQESISTSIAAGAPEADVYMADMQFGIPAVYNNLAVSLEFMGLENTDVFEAQQVMMNLNLSQPETYLFTPSVTNAVHAYPLAFNLDMILAAGLENPQDLWDAGEWTWDVWREYLIALTDADNDIYGWSGYWTDMFQNLLFSNNAAIISGFEVTVNSPPTIEVIDFIYSIYNADGTGRPWNESDWAVNNNLYAEGKSAFFIGADWIFFEFGGAELPFEIGVVPWPVGPSGDAATNKHSSAYFNWYFIPAGTENPEFVYEVIYDWFNWYDYDRELAVDLGWSKLNYMNERNFNYAYMMSRNSGFDMWQYFHVFQHFPSTILSGEINAADFAYEMEPLLQAALDEFLN
jgi:ABC-type glycerol-3-phosphate transport system substrate-binding protein